MPIQLHSGGRGELRNWQDMTPSYTIKLVMNGLSTKKTPFNYYVHKRDR